MVDENQNDEYQLSDGDLLGAGNIDSPSDESADITSTSEASAPSEPSEPFEPPAPHAIRQRNAIVVVGFIILIIIIYKIYGHFSSAKTTIEPVPAPPVVKAIAPTPPPPPLVEKIQPAPVFAPSPPSTEVNDKIASLSSAGEGLRSNMDNLNSKVSGMQVNMQAMTEKLTTLTATIDTLVAKLNTQATQMQALELRLAQMAVKPKPHPRVRPKVLYYVQAIIPGRAWLISVDGTHTITVREGSPIKGYGYVQMIDTNQGRVMTTSGRTIKFSHHDS